MKSKKKKKKNKSKVKFKKQLILPNIERNILK